MVFTFSFLNVKRVRQKTTNYKGSKRGRHSRGSDEGNSDERNEQNSRSATVEPKFRGDYLDSMKRPIVVEQL